MCIYALFMPLFWLHVCLLGKRVIQTFQHLPCGKSCVRVGRRFSQFLYYIKKNGQIYCFQEKNDGMLFVVNNFVALPGNFVTLSCVQPSFMEGYNYYLVVKHKETTLKLRSVTKSTPRLKKYSPPDSTSLLLIPHGFFDSNDHLLEMEICIWRK